MGEKDTYLGTNLGAIGAVVAIAGLGLAAFGSPHWVFGALLLVLLLFWFLAALLMSDQDERDSLARDLRHPNYTQIYKYFTTRWVMWVWNRQCDPADDKASWPQLFRAALTWRLYDTALLVAVVYPLLLLLGQWVATGTDGQLGSTIVLPAAEFWPERALFLIAMLIMIAGKIGRQPVQIHF